MLYNLKKGISSPKFRDSENSLSSERSIYFKYIRRKYPQIPTDIVENIIEEEISDKEVKLYLSILVSIFLDVNIKGKRELEDQRFTTVIDEITIKNDPYRIRNRMRNTDHGRSQRTEKSITQGHGRHERTKKSII